MEVNDFMIVGAGISGLYVAYNLRKMYPLAKICMIEKADYVGGRLVTVKYDDVIFEAGASRFNDKQTRILKLINELGLDNKKVFIDSDINYIPVNPKYDKKLESIFPSILDFIKDVKSKQISKEILTNTTLIELADKYYNPSIKEYIKSIYPYYSEMGILNALEAIHLFDNEFSNKVQYYSMQGGIQQLATRLYNKLKKTMRIDLNTTLKIIKKDNGIYSIKTDKMVVYLAKKLILALPKPALSRINYLTQNKNVLEMINSVEVEPLYRIYAKYSKIWFNDIKKTSTNLPIKYIFPVDY